MLSFFFLGRRLKSTIRQQENEWTNRRGCTEVVGGIVEKDIASAH